MLADAGPPAVLAAAPLAVMLADAAAPAVLELGADAVILALSAPPLRLAVIFPPFFFRFFLLFSSMLGVVKALVLVGLCVTQVAGDGYACKSTDDCAYFGCK
jgi:hypothetical protein